MSGFYGQLAKEALGDDVSDVSDGELDDMLADMDDLDAGLFGSSNIPKVAPPAPISKLAKEPPKIEHEIQDFGSSSIKAASIFPNKKKTELLAELFGDDESNDSLQQGYQPSSQIPPKSSSVKFKIEDEFSSRPIEIKSSLNFETEKNESLSGSYMPLSGERRKRNFQRNKPVQDLWSEFLLPPDAGPAKVEFTVEDAKPTEEEYVDERKKTVPIRKEIIEIKTEVLAPVPVENKNHSPAVKFELTDEMKEDILKIIEEQQKNQNDRIKQLDEELKEVKNEKKILTGEIIALQQQAISQKALLQEMEDKLAEQNELLNERLGSFETQCENSLLDFHSQQKEQASDILCQMSQLEEQMRDLQHASDSIQPEQASLKDKISKLMSKQEKEMHEFSNHVQSLREIQSDENKKLRKYFEEKIYKIASEIGDYDIVDGKLKLIEAKVKKLILNFSNSNQEEEIVQKLECSESGMLKKLNYCSNQQTRQESWHQQQLNDITQHMDQRLWGLHRQLDLNVSSVKGEINILRTDMTNRLGEMESKVGCAENETCRLSRLAERLCGLLQLWEMRNKESSRIQEVAEQSLRERFSLIIAERHLDQS